jgi:hypothetical protein
VSGNKSIQRGDQHEVLVRGQRDPKKRGTDPYCPSVWATPLEDAPFIIESDKKFPAGTGKRTGDEIVRDTLRGGDRYEELRGLT